MNFDHLFCEDCTFQQWYSFWKINIKTRKKDIYRENRARYTNRTKTENFHFFQLWQKYRKLWIKILKSILLFLFIIQTFRILFIIQTIWNTYFEMSNFIYLSFKRRFKFLDIFRYFCFSNTFNDRIQLHIQENFIFKLTRLNFFIYQESKSKRFSERHIVNMSNRERTIKFRNFVDYFYFFIKKHFSIKYQNSSQIIKINL